MSDGPRSGKRDDSKMSYMGAPQGSTAGTEHHTGEGDLSSASGEQKTPMLDLMLLLTREKRRIVLMTLGGMLLGGLLAFLMNPTYTAIATILPPTAPQSSLNSLMGQLGSLSALSGGGSLLKNPADLYVGILQSRTIADQVIDQFHLESLWHFKRRDDTRKALAKQVQFEVGKAGLIEITVKDKAPKQASDLANFYVDALYRMNSSLAITEAGQRRLFYDQQLADEKAALVKAEEDLKSTQLKTGLISLTGQADLAIRNVAQTRAQIASREVELQSLRAYESDENPDVIRLQQELGTLRSQLAALESNQKQLAPGDTQIATDQMPAGSLEYIRKLREVKYHDTLLELLSRQYEAARIDEAKSAPIIQVVDRAVPPDRKSGPPRLLILLGSGLLGFCVACAWSFSRSAIQQARQKPEVEFKLAQIRTLLSWRRF
jgi:tyrosine-protein kinase Etk/Wzc